MTLTAEESFVRRLFVELYGLELRKLPEAKVKTPDFEMSAAGQRFAVVEVKSFERVPATAENGWTILPKNKFGSQAATRLDNGPERVGRAIHEAFKQLSMYTEPKVLVFVNNDSRLDEKDLKEVIEGVLYYGSEETGYYANRASAKIAEGRIREEKYAIDLYIWIDQWWNGDQNQSDRIWFKFPTEIGYDLARRFFRCPELNGAP